VIVFTGTYYDCIEVDTLYTDYRLAVLTLASPLATRTQCFCTCMARRARASTYAGLTTFQATFLKIQIHLLTMSDMNTMALTPPFFMCKASSTQNFNTHFFSLFLGSSTRRLRGYSSELPCVRTFTKPLTLTSGSVTINVMHTTSNIQSMTSIGLLCVPVPVLSRPMKLS
jgi:hypothetical protein